MELKILSNVLDMILEHIKTKFKLLSKGSRSDLKIEKGEVSNFVENFMLRFRTGGKKNFKFFRKAKLRFGKNVNLQTCRLAEKLILRFKN